MNTIGDTIRRFPLTTGEKHGHMPSLYEMMKAYNWRVDAMTTVNIVDMSLTEKNKQFLLKVLFPAPYEVKSESEFRAFLVKIVVADGLWAQYQPGMPFTEYIDDDGSQMYSTEEAIQYANLFNQAIESIGQKRIWELSIELSQMLLAVI